MTASIWAYAVVLLGLGGFVLFLYLTGRARVPTLTKALGALIALVCFYPAILWGGQLAGAWTITPEFGRLALVLCLFALLWLGILSLGQPQR